MKTVRQVAILDIIEKQDIETQEDLAEALRQRGIRRDAGHRFPGHQGAKAAEGAVRQRRV